VGELIDFQAFQRRKAEEAGQAAMAAAAPAAFAYTEDQATAMHLLGGDARHTMLYGGSRSGKTFLIVTALVIRAIKAPGSRHLITRFRFNHVKTAVGMDTLPAVMAKRFPGTSYKIDKTDWVCRIGDSEIWLGGLDDKEPDRDGLLQAQGPSALRRRQDL
jgi:hypothetical protein